MGRSLVSLIVEVEIFDSLLLQRLFEDDVVTLTGWTLFNLTVEELLSDLSYVDFGCLLLDLFV